MLIGMIAPSESACASRWPYAGPEDEQRDHDHAAADAEQSGENARPTTPIASEA